MLISFFLYVLARTTKIPLQGNGTAAIKKMFDAPVTIHCSAITFLKLKFDEQSI